MIEDTLARIEKRLETLETLDADKRQELSELFRALKTEVTGLSRTDTEPAESITRFAAISAHEATRREPNPALHRLSLEGLAASVRGFEVSHPALVRHVNAICMALSDIGV
jgi:hypothetical protein